MSAEGVRTAFSSAARKAALLQREVSAICSAMVELESPAELSRDKGRQGQAQPAEPAVSRTSQKP
jgi:hypothetical protein